MFPKKLQKKLQERVTNQSLRTLTTSNDLIDFSSNDYLGFSASETIFHRASEILKHQNIKANGATGSRLLTGNHRLYEHLEQHIAQFHNTEAALLFNSGYDANVGFFSSVPQRGDIILYDELCHASIRDGIQMSHANAYKFRHNDVTDFKTKLENFSLPLGEMPKGQRGDIQDQNVFVVTESVFSMDGDMGHLEAIATLCETYASYLIVDEAHALGVMGVTGAGLVQALGLEHQVFARIMTFGKALGCHGAAIVGSKTLQQYLVNFARSFMYTTGLPPHAVATIQAGYEYLGKSALARNKLNRNIAILHKEIRSQHLKDRFIESKSAIHCCLIPENTAVKKVAENLQKHGFDVRPILSPTVPKGKERIRICVHSFNSEKEVIALVTHLKAAIETLNL